MDAGGFVIKFGPCFKLFHQIAEFYLLRFPSSSLVQVEGKQERFFWFLGFHVTTATALRTA